MGRFVLLLLVALPFVNSNAPCASFQGLSGSSLKAFEKSNAEFAKHLFRLARENHENENIFFSPASISLALGMLLEGARGNTREEIKNQLAKDVDDAEISKCYSHFIFLLNAENALYELYAANKFYAYSEYKLSKEYVESLTQCFESDAKLVDFENIFEEIRNEVNQWVEEKTNKKIKDLLTPGSVSNATRLVLVNAIYFKAQWETPFTNKSETFDAPFYPTGNSEGQNAKFMTHIASYRYFSDENLQALELPYKGKELSMYIILPSKDKELRMEELEKVIDKLDEKLIDSKVEVDIPKFKLTQNLPLKAILAKMGIRDMFDELGADLSGVNGHGDLCVSDAFHKAFIEVNENGTEAAAATGFSMSTMPHAPPPEFKADHPFFFFIKHKETNSFLFSGYLASVDQ